jgi:hypothetical protein
MPFFQDHIINDFLGLYGNASISILANKNINFSELKPKALDICRKLILKTYLNRTLKSAEINPKFEIVALYETADASNPIAFLVAEKGECEILPVVWSVNLICAVAEGTHGTKSAGQILMGLYLFTIATNPEVIDKRGILELANGYINAAGLASYSKLGFVIDESLYGDRCFADYNNLPMIADDIDPARVIRILQGSVGDSYVKPPICDIRGAVQLYLGVAMNLLNVINNVPRDELDDYIIDDYGMNDNRVINYRYLYNLVSRNIPGFTKQIDSALRGSASARLPGLLEIETAIVITKAKTPSAEAPSRRSRSTRIQKTEALVKSNSSSRKSKHEGKSSRRSKRGKKGK